MLVYEKKRSIADKTTKSRGPDCSGVGVCGWSKYLHPAYMLLIPIVLASFVRARFNNERALNRTEYPIIQTQIGPQKRCADRQTFVGAS